MTSFSSDNKSMFGLRALLAGAVVAAVTGAGLVAPAAATSAPTKKVRNTTPSVRVVSYNICKVSCGTGKYAWPKRRKKVARIATSLNADVVLIQEASTLPWRSTTQWRDVARLMRKRGYQIATMKDGCKDFCTRGSHVFYNPDTIEPIKGLWGKTVDPAPPAVCMPYWNMRDELRPRHTQRFYDNWYDYRCHKHMGWEPIEDMSADMISQQILSGVPWGKIKDRNISWAFLRHKATSKAFVAASAHLPPDKTPTGETARQAVARAFPSWMSNLTASLGYPGIPVIIGGDLNSFAERQPRGAHKILADAGFTDAFKAKTRVNARYSTVNQNGRFNARYKGWPPKPYKYGRPATRIDYVFATGLRPLRHEVFIPLLKNGNFDDRWRASDHNPVITDWALPAY